MPRILHLALIVVAVTATNALAQSIAFLIAQQLDSGIAPYAVEAVDVDGDGDLDLLTANIESDGPNSISVIKNLGGGSFAAPVRYAVGEDPTNIATGDFNGDGRPDIVVPNSGSGQSVGQQSTVSVLINNGSGVFGPAQNYNVGENARPEDVEVADFNGDRILDFAVASSTGYTISVFRGTGTGTFTLQGHYHAESAQALDVGDFDGDGDIDIVFCNVDAAQILRNNGTSFSSGVYLYNFPIGCMDVVAGDFNGDNALDFATTGRSLTMHFNNGTGTAFSKVYYPTGENAGGVDAADFDNDGHLDIAASNYLANSVSVWTNNGSGAFLPRRDWGVGPNPWGIGLGDVDGDGRIDIVAPNSQLSQTQVTSVINQGDRTFLARREYGQTGGARGVKIADLDLDGLPDVVAGVAFSNQDNVAIYYGQTDGTFEDATYVENFLNNMPTDVAVGRFNNDNRPDVVASIFSPGNRIRVFINLGNRTFAPSASYEAGGNPSSVDAADLNGDGYDDVICTNSAIFDNDISVFINNGDGTFAPQVRIPTLLRPSDVAIADLDQDGDRDVVVTHYNATSIVIFRNDGFGNLSAPQVVGIGNPQGEVVLRDFTGDGVNDIIVATGQLLLLTNIGGGNFGAPQNTSVPGSRAEAADFDRDGDLDIVGTEYVQSQVRIGRNNGNGSFTLVRTMFAGYETDRVAAADTDRDGLPDVVTANVRARSISFFKNITDAGAVIPPTGVTVGPGIIIGGNLASLTQSDDNRLVIRPGVVFSTGQFPVTVIVDGVAPTSSPVSLKLVAESSASSQNVFGVIEAFNFATGVYDVLFAGQSQTSDISRVLTVDNPVDHIGPGNFVRVRMRFRANGPVFAYPWQTRLDHVAWRIID